MVEKPGTDELSHLPAEKLSAFSKEQRATIQRLLDSCAETGTPDVDLSFRPGEDGKQEVTLTIAAKDWAGLGDAVMGVLHERGYNIQFLQAFVTKSGKLAVIIINLSLDPSEMERLDRDKRDILSLMHIAARGGLSIKKLVSIGAKKVRIYNEVLLELEKSTEHELYEELTRPLGELEQFVTSRSESYLGERYPADLAGLVVESSRLQKAVFLREKPVAVAVVNLVTLKEELTAVTVAGSPRVLSLEGVLELLRGMEPDFRLAYDKEFVTTTGVCVVHIEISDPEGRQFPEKTLPVLKGYLEENLKKARETRQEFRLKSGAELVGRILVPRLVDEAARTDTPQALILPEEVAQSSASFRLIVVTALDGRQEGHIREELVMLLNTAGLTVGNARSRTMRGMEVDLLTVLVDLGQFTSELDIYETLKGALEKAVPGYRDFDEGMRKMDSARLESLQEILKERVPVRFVKKLFYEMDDGYRVTTPPETLSEEIFFAHDLLNRHFGSSAPVVDRLVEPDFILFGVAGPPQAIPINRYIERFSRLGAMLTGIESLGANVYLFKVKRGKGLKQEELMAFLRGSVS